MSDELREEIEQLESPPPVARENPWESQNKKLSGVAKRLREENESLKKQLADKDLEVVSFKHRTEFRRIAESSGCVDFEAAWKIGDYQPTGEPNEKVISGFFDDLKKNKSYLFKQAEAEAESTETVEAKPVAKSGPGGKSGTTSTSSNGKVSYEDMRNPAFVMSQDPQVLAALLKAGFN